MALTQIDFDDDEEMVIREFSNEWKTNKPKTVKRIIKETKINMINNSQTQQREVNVDKRF